jgi:hypothetical protein
VTPLVAAYAVVATLVVSWLWIMSRRLRRIGRSWSDLEES